VLILIARARATCASLRSSPVSVRTVETHRLNLRRKLGIETAAGLANYAIKRGWIEE